MIRCNIYRASDDYILNVRDTDAIGEEYGMTDTEMTRMELQLDKMGRYWLDADTFCKPVTRRLL
ncbi:MAG TPA: hypothetical protein VK629_05695 [Steroidobacteraceae bacterium]|nr:hypothetical protein [Steroidobacteraceae bacterium]